LAVRLIRALRLALRDERIPRPIRWLGGVALLPIPGPIDELVLLALLPLLLAYRELLREAWSLARKDHA
jgi:hypothetical protein